MDYLKESERTLSDQYHGDLVPMRVLQRNLEECIASGQKLDVIKKSLFYGKPNAFAWQSDRFLDPDCSETQGVHAQNILHGILGAFTEAVELLEAFMKPDGIDHTNIKEEVGDLFWYLAILARECGFTFEEAMEVNIAKLRARYPDKFNAIQAVNRNLEVERKVLENKPDPQVFRGETSGSGDNGYNAYTDAIRGDY